MRPIILVAACVLGGLFVDSASAQEKLAWKFKEGDRFYLEEKVSIKQTIKVLGTTEEKEEDQLNVVTFLVKSKTKDSIILVQTIEELKTDTKKGKADPGGQQVLDKMRGHEFTITINNKGEITNFEGYESLMKKMSGDDPNVEKVLRSILPVDFFKKTSQQTFSMLPDKAVGVGDTWQREMNMSMGPMGGFKVVHSYKYDGDEKGLAVISSTAKLDYIAPKGGDAGLPFKIIKGNMKAENAKNRILFDNKLGRPRSDIGSATIRGTMTMEIANMEVEMELHLEQTSRTRVTATKPGKDDK
jgi:hypothetical protein